MNSLEPDPQKKEKEDADDDVFPFFGNSSLVLACGGPHIGQIILSYCDAIVSAFVRLHQLETQERKKPLASIELLLQRSSHTRCEDRFYQHLTTYIDWFYALEQERAQEEPENYKYHFLEIQDKLNSYFEGKTRNLRDLSNQCLADQCSDRLRTLMMEWVAGKNVHNLPVNRWMTKDQMQKLLDATTIKLSVDHYRGHLYTSPPLFEVRAEIVIRDNSSNKNETKFEFKLSYSEANFDQMRFIAILPHPPDEITNKYVRLIWVEPVSKMNEELNMSRIKKIPELKPLREAFNLSSDISSACILALLFCSLVPERYAQAKLGSPTSPIAISLWKSINLVIS